MHQELKDREYYNGFIMNKSFRDWIKSCPKEYSWQMNQVTKDTGTYTFFLEEKEDYYDLSLQRSSQRTWLQQTQQDALSVT